MWAIFAYGYWLYIYYWINSSPKIHLIGTHRGIIFFRSSPITEMHATKKKEWDNASTTLKNGRRRRELHFYSCSEIGSFHILWIKHEGFCREGEDWHVLWYNIVSSTYSVLPKPMSSSYTVHHIKRNVLESGDRKLTSPPVLSYGKKEPSTKK